MGNFFLSSPKGQTLIEVLAAFGIAVSLVSAITVTVIFALSTTQFGKNKNLATQYAQQGIEVVRRMQDSGQLKDVADGTQCLNIGRNSLTTKTSAECPADASFFVREVTIRSGTGSSCYPSRQIILTLKWSDNKCTQDNLYCHKTEITSCLSGVKSVATPGQVAVSPTPSPTPYPSPVLSSVTNTGGGGNMTIVWTSVPNATSYTLYGCQSSGGSCTPSSVWYRDITGTSIVISVDSSCRYYDAFSLQAIFPFGGVSGLSNVLGEWGCSGGGGGD